ncbi:hypothetical protein PUNSTDRAFT_138378 [Punctularia strigosozonata HHB-11173 SS5]|uniref:Uncharacterized protein n=1 Tax=Punctularia strigosozonata (strain HHB-11173) TaxID=741275 RepID=R7S3G4_PUNST|nr:uncharacterized protein PUNSTDRAFT_138378 [Punctularia strigosozonata HHB-11173 SS5]EIN04733.1 hypothetical protein PUNSTDRAFT_138378 [Punctularia strigosozonata HHB-11173 SS5]
MSSPDSIHIDPQPNVVYPHTVPPNKSILKPDLKKYPWFEYVIPSWSDKVDRLPQASEEEVILDKFVPFDELPAEFDAWSEPLKYAPPEFYFGWPMDKKILRNYAIKNGLASFKKGLARADDPDYVGDLLENQTVFDIIWHLEPLINLKVEEVYGVQEGQDRFGGLWSLCDNYTPPDKRPTEETITRLQQEFGYEERPKWYMTTFA